MMNSIQRNFDKAAHTYDEHAIVQVKAGEALFNLLDKEFKSGKSQQPFNIIDLGAGTGRFSQKLLDYFPQSKVCAFDLSHRMMLTSQQKESKVYCVQGDFDVMPFQSDSIDLIFSNFALQWSLDLPQTFSECVRVLKNQGILLFSMPGPSTLHELKFAFEKIDAYTHINTFHSIESVQAFLEEQPLNLIHTQSENFKLGFNDIFSLLKHLKYAGANSLICTHPNAHIQKSLMTPNKIKALSNAYKNFEENNHLPTTYEALFFIVQKRNA